MSYFNWNEDDINKSSLDQIHKKILIAESNGSTDKLDPSCYSKHTPSLSRYKLEYWLQKKQLLEYYGPLISKTLELYKHFPYNMKTRFTPEQAPFSPEILLAELANFFYFLGDDEIFNAYRELVLNRRDHLKIQRVSQNKILTTDIQGRCISNLDTKEAFLSLFIKGDASDFPVAAHECGHYLITSLYGSEVNPLMRNFLSETEGKYFEYLALFYLYNNTVNKDASLILESNEILTIIENIWVTKIQECLYNQPGIFYNHKKVNKELSKIPGSISVTKDDYESLVRLPLAKLISDINASLVALDLYDLANKNLPESLKKFKNLYSSNNTNYQKLFEENDITYLSDYSNLQKYARKSLEIQDYYM